MNKIVCFFTFFSIKKNIFIRKIFLRKNKMEQNQCEKKHSREEEEKEEEESISKRKKVEFYIGKNFLEDKTYWIDGIPIEIWKSHILFLLKWNDLKTLRLVC